MKLEVRFLKVRVADWLRGGRAVALTLVKLEVSVRLLKRLKEKDAQLILGKVMLLVIFSNVKLTKLKVCFVSKLISCGLTRVMLVKLRTSFESIFKTLRSHPVVRVQVLLLEFIQISKKVWLPPARTIPVPAVSRIIFWKVRLLSK